MLKKLQFYPNFTVFLSFFSFPSAHFFTVQFLVFSMPSTITAFPMSLWYFSPFFSQNYHKNLHFFKYNIAHMQTTCSDMQRTCRGHAGHIFIGKKHQKTLKKKNTHIFPIHVDDMQETCRRHAEASSVFLN